MARNRTIAQLYDSFLAEQDTARGVGVIEAAYHTLAAALHCAEALGDEARVERVKTLADRIRFGIDRDNPDHCLATASAALRGQTSVFASLAGQAESIAARLRASRATHHSRAIRRSAMFAPGEASDSRLSLLDLGPGEEETLPPPLT